MTRTILAVLAAVLALAGTARADWQKLVDPAGLAALAEAGGVTVLDIREPREYATAHLPGAVNAPYGAWRGPAENPGQPLTDAALTGLFQGLGLTRATPVVVAHAGIDQTDFGAAARVYWTLKSAGLERIAILNGGVRGWVAEGRPLAVDPVRPARSTESFALSSAWMADREAVAAAVAGAGSGAGPVLADARPAAFHAGTAKHPAARSAGTIPTARSLAHDTWFAGDATALAPAERIAALAAERGLGAGPGVVSFCNTGHWAATGWFAMSEMAGIEGVKLYPESVVGWTAAGGPTVPGQP